MTFQGRFRRLLALFMLATTLAMATAGRVAVAAKVDDLAKALASDPSFKVRVQAAVLLGKLGDKAAVDPLVKALNDDNKTVRAMAAQSLGRLASPSAGPGLKALLERERDTFVREQAQKALASIKEKESKEANGHAVFVTIGPFVGGSRSADTEILTVLRESLRRSLEKVPQITFAADTDAKGRGKSAMLGFLVDGNVSRLEDVDSGSGVETSCEVKVMVARWPSKSVILWTSAGAAVQGGARDRDRLNARRDCIEASAGQVADSLAGFFRSQGG